VPALSLIGAVVLGLGMLSIGLYGLRRRARQA
jgi:hypothetical protein